MTSGPRVLPWWAERHRAAQERLERAESLQAEAIDRHTGEGGAERSRLGTTLVVVGLAGVMVLSVARLRGAVLPSPVLVIAVLAVGAWFAGRAISLRAFSEALDGRLDLVRAGAEVVEARLAVAATAQRAVRALALRLDGERLGRRPPWTDLGEDDRAHLVALVGRPGDESRPLPADPEVAVPLRRAVRVMARSAADDPAQGQVALVDWSSLSRSFDRAAAASSSSAGIAALVATTVGQRGLGVALAWASVACAASVTAAAWLGARGRELRLLRWQRSVRHRQASAAIDRRVAEAIDDAARLLARS